MLISYLKHNARDNVNVIDYLKSTPLFEALTEKQMECLSATTKLKSYDKDDCIVYKGDEGTDVFIVVEGTCRGTLIDDDGDEVLLSTFERNDIFGEMNLFDKKGRTGTIVANEELKLLRIPQNAFGITLKENSDVCLKLMSILVDRLRKADELIESLAFLNVKERIMKQLVDIANDSGVKSGEFFKIKKYTHLEISSMIGASRESVTKCIKILTIEGLIKIKDDHILVKQPPIIF